MGRSRKIFYPVFSSSRTLYFCSCKACFIDFQELIDHVILENDKSASPDAPATAEFHVALSKTMFFVPRGKKFDGPAPGVSQTINPQIPEVRKMSAEERKNFFSNPVALREIHKLDDSNAYYFPPDMNQEETTALVDALKSAPKGRMEDAKLPDEPELE